MTLTREVSLQTLAVLDQAETDIDRLITAGKPPDQIAGTPQGAAPPNRNAQL